MFWVNKHLIINVQTDSEYGQCYQHESYVHVEILFCQYLYIPKYTLFLTVRANSAMIIGAPFVYSAVSLKHIHNVQKSTSFSVCINDYVIFILCIHRLYFYFCCICKANYNFNTNNKPTQINFETMTFVNMTEIKCTVLDTY